MKRELKEPSSALLVVAVFWQKAFENEYKEIFKNVPEWVSLEFGKKLGPSSSVFNFDQTSYYEKEMGAELKKVFVQIGDPVSRDGLVKFKIRSREIEDQFLNSTGSRLVNIDPMIVSIENVVVSTSKNFPHRIYLGHGVFGDLQLIRRKGGYEGLPWTYKDYVEQIPYFDSLAQNGL